MKRRLNRVAGIIVLLAVAEIAAAGAAFARAGGSNFMNSPGYQRRLQESRGYVANQSGSVFSAPRTLQIPPVGCGTFWHRSGLGLSRVAP